MNYWPLPKNVDGNPKHLRLGVPVRAHFTRITEDFQTPVFRLERP